MHDVTLWRIWFSPLVWKKMKRGDGRLGGLVIFVWEEILDVGEGEVLSCVLLSTDLLPRFWSPLASNLERHPSKWFYSICVQLSLPPSSSVRANSLDKISLYASTYKTDLGIWNQEEHVSHLQRDHRFDPVAAAAVLERDPDRGQIRKTGSKNLR